MSSENRRVCSAGTTSRFTLIGMREQRSSTTAAIPPSRRTDGWMPWANSRRLARIC